MPVGGSPKPAGGFSSDLTTLINPLVDRSRWVNGCRLSNRTPWRIVPNRTWQFDCHASSAMTHFARVFQTSSAGSPESTILTVVLASIFRISRIVKIFEVSE